MLFLGFAINKISSKYTIKNFPINGINTYVITLIKVLGVFERPKGMTSNSYKPSLVLNVVFHSSPKQIIIWWYPFFRLILEKILAPTIISSKSSNQGMRKWYLIVILLLTRLSTHIRHDPSFLGVNMAGIVQELKLSRINPFCNSSHTCLCNLACLLGFILQWGKYGSVALGIQSMACWMSCIRGKTLGSLEGKHL